MAARYRELCATIGESGASAIRYDERRRPTPTIRLRRCASCSRSGARRTSGAGATHTGPHRDDARAHARRTRAARRSGRPGQQRTAAIALRLLEAETFSERTGAAPVFLLDDPFAELDARRGAAIVDVLRRARAVGQTFLAVPQGERHSSGLTALDARASVQRRTDRDRDGMSDERRRSRSRSATSLQSWIDKSGIATRIDQAGVVPEWHEARRSADRGGDGADVDHGDGTLCVQVTTNAWMNELSLMEPELLRSLNARPGGRANPANPLAVAVAEHLSRAALKSLSQVKLRADVTDCCICPQSR